MVLTIPRISVVYKTSPLERLCSFLESQKPNWNNIIKIYKIYREDYKNLPMHQYHNDFMQIFVKLSLLKAANERRDLLISCAYLNSDEYEFSRDRFEKIIRGLGRVLVRRKKNKKPLNYITASFDNVIMMDGEPVIIEPLLNGFKEKDFYRLKIIEKTTKKRPKYIIVTPRENISALNAKHFKRKKGLISLLYTSKDDFKKQVNEIADKFFK